MVPTSSVAVQTEWSFPPLAHIDPPATPIAQMGAGGPLRVALSGGSGTKRPLNGCDATVVEGSHRAGWASVVVRGETHAWRSHAWHALGPVVGQPDYGGPTLPDELLTLIALFVEDPATKAALAQTCRVAREALAARGWPEIDLRYGRADSLGLILRLGLTLARPRSLKMDCGLNETGLLGWIAERCDLSALERLEVRISGGLLHTISNGPIATSHSQGLGLVLSRLSPAYHSSMRAQFMTASPLAGFFSRSPLLCLLGWPLLCPADLRALELKPRLHRLTLRIGARWSGESECADPRKELQDVLSRLPLLEELSIEMSWCEWPCDLRFTSQSLRLLDLRGMGKSCQVSYLACPALEEVRTLYRGSYEGGILPLARKGNGFRVINTHGGLPATFSAFGAHGSLPSHTRHGSLPVDLPEKCRVMIYLEDWRCGRSDLPAPAEFCQRRDDDGSWSWQMQAAGALPFDFDDDESESASDDAD
ncbi:hypothetical protein T492DRAFT_1010165 [Pavlovales sp. CCMP2436]|nr:hypothetical protein T492DRAFT_1010165 [Pavlovales sp. CCMP2436]|mmetsp:Transcript_22823/g.56932  ORF Transcript_22823/g.56932 Transcript_22823/m.56932 type:complete len:479 (-) Transcript_22823:55-1491(-)